MVFLVIFTVTNGSDTSLLCSHCKDPFPNAWDLMVHIQATHMINIYELGVPYSDDKEDSSGRSNTSSPINSQHEKTVRNFVEIRSIL